MGALDGKVVAVTGAGSDGVFRATAFEEALKKRFSHKVLDGIDENTPTHIVESRILTFDHAMLGGFVARRWNFPDAVADAIKALGAEPTPMSPAQFGALTKNDLNRYSVIVKERKITSE